ncbi:hypothetical protein C2S52_004856 [Perilla frutescens var. hirtella]|nr:hypothetical protein C2S52_004856 [Perilla frutescens var. hirtella]
MHVTSRSEVTNKVIKDLCSRSGTLIEFVQHYQQIQMDWRNRERAENAFCLGISGQYVERNRLLTHAAKVYTRNVYKIFEKEAVNNINVKLIDSPVDYTVDELEFTVGDVEERNRPRRVLFNQRTEAVSCTCRMWETEGVLCRHILKVFFTINLRRLPDGCILKRWTRHARNRSPNSILTPSSGDLMADMLFVNSVMRLTYALALECNESAEDRATVHERISVLYNDICGRKQKPTTANRHAQPQNHAPTAAAFRDPPVATHAWFLNKRAGPHCENNKIPHQQKDGGASRTITGAQCGSEWSPYGAFGSAPATNTNNGGYENEASRAVSISRCANTGLIWTVWSRVELAGRPDVMLYLRVTARTLSICTGDKTMSGTEPLSQNSSFYSGSWTRAVEKIVLQKLRLARWSRDWEPGGNSTANQTVLRRIVDEMRVEYLVTISLPSIEWKCHQWERRHAEFSEIISRSGVQYDALRNTVEASEMTWTTIAEEDPRYLIYKKGPEAEWGLMRSVFASMIQISSSADSDRSRIQISSGRSTSHLPIQIVSSTWSGFGQASSTTSDVLDQPRRSVESLPDSGSEEF